jgi:hypothetical protein
LLGDPDDLDQDAKVLGGFDQYRRWFAGNARDYDYLSSAVQGSVNRRREHETIASTVYRIASIRIAEGLTDIPD